MSRVNLADHQIVKINQRSAGEAPIYSSEWYVFRSDYPSAHTFTTTHDLGVPLLQRPRALSKHLKTQFLASHLTATLYAFRIHAEARGMAVSTPSRWSSDARTDNADFTRPQDPESPSNFSHCETAQELPGPPAAPNPSNRWQCAEFFCDRGSAQPA